MTFIWGKQPTLPEIPQPLITKISLKNYLNNMTRNNDCRHSKKTTYQGEHNIYATHSSKSGNTAFPWRKKCYINTWLAGPLCRMLHVRDTHWCLIIIGPGNGLGPSGNKPLHELVLRTSVTQVPWHHLASLDNELTDIKNNAWVTVNNDF